MPAEKKPPHEKQEYKDLSRLRFESGDDDQEEVVVVPENPDPTKNIQDRRIVIPVSRLARMVEDSMRDIESDDDEEAAGGKDDPELLRELQEITGEKAEIPLEEPQGESQEQVFLPTTTVNVIEVIVTRIRMYEAAEKDAIEAEEESRARRFNRGLRTLHEMLKQANSGKAINIEDIPPEITFKKHSLGIIKSNII